MVGRRLLTVLALILLLPSAAGSAGTPLEGEFSHDPMLVVQGDVASNATRWILDYPVPIFAGPVLAADKVQLIIQEQRVPLGVHASPPRFVSGDFAAGPTNPQRRILQDVRVELQAVLPGTTWGVYGLNLSRVDLHGADCTMTLASPVTPQRTRAFERTTEGLAQPLVAASCDARALHADGSVDWSIWNTTLLLRYRNPADGTLHVEQLRTGVLAEPNELVPGAYDEVSRRAILRWVSGAFILDWPGSTKVKVQAPRLLASGTLALAQGTGDVLWGDARFDGAPTDPAPTGSFFVASPDASRLSVQGTTQNRPVAPGAAVTGRAALLAAGAIAGIGAILLLAFGLYARLNPKDVGKHPARAAILEFLERSPGARLTEIQQQAHLPRSTALHHLRALEQAGLVMHRRVGKFLIYGRSHHHGTLNDPSFLAQRVRRHELILQILQEQPGLRQQEIAARMGVTQSYVSRILARLERDGLVGRDERDRRSFRVRASAPGSGSTGA